MKEKDEKEKIFYKDKYILIGLFIIIPILGYIIFKSKYIQSILLNIIKYFKEISNRGVYGKLIYIFFVVIMNLVFMNSTLPNLISGYIFGFYKGVLFTLTGCIISGIISFYLSRDVLKNYIYKFTSKYKELDLIKKDENKFTNKDWFELVVLSRLPPTYPFHIISYFWGITNINILLFIIGSTIGILPAISLETYIGYTIKNIHNIFKSNISLTYTIGIIVFTILITMYIGYKSKKIIDNKTKKNVSKN